MNWVRTKLELGSDPNPVRNFLRGQDPNLNPVWNVKWVWTRTWARLPPLTGYPTLAFVLDEKADLQYSAITWQTQSKLKWDRRTANSSDHSSLQRLTSITVRDWLYWSRNKTWTLGVCAVIGALLSSLPTKDVSFSYKVLDQLKTQILYLWKPRGTNS